MEDLIHHLVDPIVKHPEAIELRTVEGEAATVVEMDVHEDDLETVRGDKGRTLRAIRTIVSAAAGKKKGTVDLLDADEDLEDEE